MLDDLSREDRMRLMRFVCSFAWVDLEIHVEGRAFVRDLVLRLGLDEDETREIEELLTLPPDPEQVDPGEIPVEHRKLFLDTLLVLSATGGTLTTAQAETFHLLSQLVR